MDKKRSGLFRTSNNYIRKPHNTIVAKKKKKIVRLDPSQSDSLKPRAFKATMIFAVVLLAISGVSLLVTAPSSPPNAGAGATPDFPNGENPFETHQNRDVIGSDDP